MSAAAVEGRREPELDVLVLGQMWPSAIDKAQQLGGHVIACSDTSGHVHDPAGLDVDLLKQLKLIERGPLADYPRHRGREFALFPTGRSGTCLAA